MSTEGFFDATISLWKNRKKTTPSLKANMKEIIHQFEIALDYGEISKSKEKDLRRIFKEIYREVNEQ